MSMSLRADPGERVAIVGMAAVMPGAGNLEAYWRNLVDGVDSITDVPADRWDDEFYDPDQAQRPNRVYCRRGGFIDEFATFEPLKYGIMPASVAGIEPDQLIALEVAAAAIEDAGGPDRLPDRDRIGVIMGRGGVLNPAASRFANRVRFPGQILGVLRELMPDLDPSVVDRIRTRIDEVLGPWQPDSAVGLVPNLAASRLANRLNLRGPAYTLDAACASSLIAVDQGVTELLNGRLDMVLAAGVHHTHDISYWSVFSQIKALSRRGESRPFDRAADGLLIGEGTGIVLLKRLSDARRDGDRVYAVIRGSGTSSDGRSAGMLNPTSAGQVLAIRRAWEMAGLDPTAPDALDLLEAHGTGTPTGDAVELHSVADAFGPYRGGQRPIIGSVKSMIGHIQPAAGIASLIKTVLAVHRGVLLPTLHCENPRPEMEQTRFEPIATARPWQSDGPRRAAVNAFGFGGVNGHVIVEQLADEPAPAVAVPLLADAGGTARDTSTPSVGGASSAGGPTVTLAEADQVLWLAAADVAGLARLLERDDHEIRAMGAAGAGDTRGGAERRCRMGIVDPTDKRLATARRVVAKGQPWHGGRDIWFTPDPLLADGVPGRLAFVFPGLEAEFAPRTADIAAHFGLPDKEWSAADLGRHGAGVIEAGKLLNDALHRMGVRPDTVAGHSIGEWAAAATTGLISTTTMDDFLSGFSAESVEVPDHVFAAIGAGAARVTPMLADFPGVVLSHDNAPAQSVVNGPETQVLRLIEVLRKNNILCQTLPFRSVFHTPAFGEGLRSIGDALRSWRMHPTEIPIWSATAQAPFPMEEAKVNELFIRHMMEPVWFRQTVEAMYQAGVRVFLQVGAGQLASLIDDNLRGRPHLAMPVNVSHRDGLNQLRRVATALWVHGGSPNLRALDPPAKPAAVAAAAAGTPSAAAGAQSQPARRGPVVKLDLGGTMVRLGAGADQLLGTPTRAASPAGTPASPAATPVGVAGSSDDAVRPSVADEASSAAALAAVRRLSARSGVAAELAALLRDTTDTAVTVLGAAATSPVAPARPATPAQPSAPTRPAAPPTRPSAAPRSGVPGAPVAPPRPVVPAQPAGPAQPGGPAQPAAPATTGGGNGAARNGGVRATGTGRVSAGQPSVVHRYPLRVSLETMPYLMDHTFFVQPPDWPDPQDRWPVVPATTVVHHMMEAAERAAPGMRAVGVRDARFNRWVIAAPEQNVDVTVRSAGPDSFTVNFGTFARATIDVAAQYPNDPPAPLRFDPATERPPQVNARRMYAERLMFHGPLFQGITEIHALGDLHVRGVVVTPEPPGALLDNSLQVIGNWLFTTQPFRTVALPVGFGHIRFFGPPPKPGTAFEAVGRVRSIDDAELVVDTQLIADGRVYAQIEKAVDRRFDSHPMARMAERFPERHPMSIQQPGGWTMVFDYWVDMVTRSMAARYILGTDAFAEYERQPMATRRQWLLGRIAAKDAVRFRQWEAGHTDVYPIEVSIDNDPNGRPLARLRPGRGMRECDVSLAHCAEIGVAIARPQEPNAAPDTAGVGIDVAEITDHPDSTTTYALSTEENALLDSLAGDAAERTLWFTRFWAAKEAVGKAEGTGLDGNPRRFTVRAATPEMLTVAVADRTYRVECKEVSNPDGLPTRRYVVAWTAGLVPAAPVRRTKKRRKK